MVDNPCKVLTPEFRVSFPNVFKPKSSFEGQPEKYNCVMLFDKATDISALKKAAKLAIAKKWGDKVPKGLHNPFKDGDEKDYDGYEGCIYVNASSIQKPGLVDANVEPIISQGDFFAGCYARATVVAYAFENKLKKGVSFDLLNIQKIRDGEPFGFSRPKAEDDFEAIEGGSEDETSYADDDLPF